jgi:vitamin B12 transporter
MGGVINIITRKGTKTPRRNVTVEAGSYGTLSTRATMSGGDDRWTYSLGVNLLHSDGFPRYGYRIDRPLVDGAGDPLPPLPSDDPTDKGGLAGRFTYKISENASIDAGFSLFGNALRFDNPYAYAASDVFSPYNHSRALIGDGFVRANFDAPGGALHNSLTVFSNVTDRDIWETEGCYDDVTFTSFNCRSGYLGVRYGVEYQGDLNLGGFGDFVFGARNETETARSSQDPNPDDGSFTPISARQITNSVFAEQRFKLLDRLDLTLGGRIDAIEGGQTFDTWRATAAYHIDETGTKLRASVGTGAKAPTLYQLYGGFGTPGLAPEQSFGFDFGVDQKLFGDRATVSATVFDTRYRDLIDFADIPACTGAQVSAGGGCYYNVGRADTQGVELSGDVVLVPEVWRARVSYTYLDARDLDANTQLLRRPRNKGALSLIYGGIAKLEVEGRLTLVGSRLDYNYPADVTLAPYAKLDLLANYKFDDNFAMFGRIENLTDARYEEAYNYGVAGRSYYAGISYSW